MKRFLPIPPLRVNDQVAASVLPRNVGIHLEYIALTVDEARALAEWLAKVLPMEGA